MVHTWYTRSGLGSILRARGLECRKKKRACPAIHNSRQERKAAAASLTDAKNEEKPKEKEKEPEVAQTSILAGSAWRSRQS